MKTIRSHLGGRWCDVGGARTPLVNPATEELLAEIATTDLDWPGALHHARTVGGPALRALSFAERGELLRALSKLIHANRDELLGLAVQNGGNTRSDAKFDVDGASGTLAAYAELGAQLGSTKLLVDGEGVQLGRSVRLYGHHVSVPREGVAVHVNAFNFPAWNMMEKAAVALLAGMPVVTKPATATALVAHRIVELMDEAKVLPAGAFSFVAGSVGDLLTHLGGQDVLAFTGSSDTGAHLRGHPQVIAGSVRVNIEADSLNAAVLGPDLERGSEAYDLFINEVSRDITQKTGQKCTAIRRVLVPRDRMEMVREDLIERLARVKVGDPTREEVTMGPVATAQQLKDVREGIARLREEADSVLGGDGRIEAPIGVPAGKGFFVQPVLLEARDPMGARAVHAHEVFGPVATLLAYSGTSAEAVELVRRGGGALVSSIYSDDRSFLGELVSGLAAHHGRLYLGSSKIAGQTMGPGTVLPQLVHGGPGRAGAGEELGGARGLAFYMQRTALSGDKPILQALLDA